MDDDPVGATLITRLFRFADGSGRFPGDSQVRFYSNGTFWNSLGGRAAEDHDSYSLCSGQAPDVCPASYLTGLRGAAGYQVVSRLPAACGPANRLVGERRGGGTQTAYAIWAGSGPCGVENAIQIRYDAPDQVRAVNQVNFVVADPADERAIADRFIAFARGTSDTFPVDTPVRLYRDGAYIRTLSTTEAQTRASYRSGLRWIREVVEKPALRRSPEIPTCLRHSPELTTAVTGGSKSLLISDVDAPCAWGVQLWINDVGQVVAIDLRSRRAG